MQEVFPDLYSYTFLLILLLKHQQGNNRPSSFAKGFNSFFTHICY